MEINFHVIPRVTFIIKYLDTLNPKLCDKRAEARRVLPVPVFVSVFVIDTTENEGEFLKALPYHLKGISARAKPKASLRANGLSCVP